jgi:uncharacterized membrane protein
MHINVIFCALLDPASDLFSVDFQKQVLSVFLVKPIYLSPCLFYFLLFVFISLPAILVSSPLTLLSLFPSCFSLFLFFCPVFSLCKSSYISSSFSFCPLYVFLSSLVLILILLFNVLHVAVR